MKGYEKINLGQSWDTIGRKIAGQLKCYPDTNEIMYLRGSKTDRMYAAYILQENQTSPVIKNSEFIHAVPLEDLVETLNGESFPHKLPKKIRVIRPDQNRNMWGVFFSK
ncbi:MAG: hypothetical protein PHF86_14495 [Candidatus Nanoarchaeia archaeon]|nr:hypothetical protein [Candidatus Nanoarchaeia archaeon]